MAGSVVLGASQGCDSSGSAPRPDPSAGGPDPLLPLLDEARALVAAYTQIALSQPGLAARLDPLADDHRAHTDELTSVIGAQAPSGPAIVASAPGAADAVAGLRQAELDAQRSAASLCRRISADRACLVGSIAACRATHAEALR